MTVGKSADHSHPFRTLIPSTKRVPKIKDSKCNLSLRNTEQKAANGERGMMNISACKGNPHRMMANSLNEIGKARKKKRNVAHGIGFPNESAEFIGGGVGSVGEGH
jgi:hypothetical protein